MALPMNFRSAASLIRTLVLAAALPVLAAWAPAASAQGRAFASPEAAMLAFGDALATSDDDAMHALLGADYHRLIPAVGADVRYRFLEAWARSHAIRPIGEGRAAIAVGGDGWTLPIPLVRDAKGWRFDTRSGADEMRLRRIGRNERSVMQVMLAIVDAQKDYAQVDRDGDGVREYARRFASSAGRKDGLYWPTAAGEPASPLGPVFAAASASGAKPGEGYYGYRYRLLTAQGPKAPGGAYDYVAGKRLIGGFAAIAWPAVYGETGVMTFAISHAGVLYEKDLGRDTAARAAAIVRFDPDDTWRRVEAD